MPYITNESLCRFCKHYKSDLGKHSERICDAFPQGIPVEIYARDMEYDHREPYPGDNDIQFEKIEDENELRKRFPRYSNDGFLNVVENRFAETLTKLDMGRQGGWIKPVNNSE